MSNRHKEQRRKKQKLHLVNLCVVQQQFGEKERQTRGTAGAFRFRVFPRNDQLPDSLGRALVTLMEPTKRFLIRRNLKF